ncbi:uncharacterized protein AMSG_10202 [Thecamonas trahens ATCC 50062]|uniref:Uncharacterized protein n=1 Tax=Thecamonas trahens ATCC 50062 TaxID=461836 RepID=A0A0L0DU03_THETB|nr:hypothetical protein AMSG_10202 [Thecamonas trahens ATCC 50062]KNC54958.1 hypothetical protein AMSG_10202 [Thecamonas trahens ATCC 50062]|eukprot:XP_013753406.1 hypothetical protein AMSG_10202 [Thecamonas trahens ATCC 50062]
MPYRTGGARGGGGAGAEGEPESPVEARARGGALAVSTPPATPGSQMGMMADISMSPLTPAQSSTFSMSRISILPTPPLMSGGLSHHPSRVIRDATLLQSPLRRSPAPTAPARSPSRAPQFLANPPTASLTDVLLPKQSSRPAAARRGTSGLCAKIDHSPTADGREEAPPPAVWCTGQTDFTSDGGGL